MRRTLSLIAIMAVMLLMAVGASGLLAGDVVLTHNTGATSTRWYISGEPSLVMVGFDLTAKGVKLPTQVDKISINVRRAMPGNPVEALVYQDADGGSPQNATLLKRQTVDITTNGVFTVTFDQPVTVTQQYLWVGFYLPVDFEFFADTSGTSALTYWGWKPGTVFDVANLSTATVFGPANGTDPVKLDMKGNARITAELITNSPQVVATPTGRVTQIVGDPSTSLKPMQAYTGCSNVYFDIDDLGVSYQNSVSFACRQIGRWLAPDDPVGYERRGVLFDVYAFGVPTGLTPLPYPVTHCVDPRDEFVGNAVLGLAQGAPREWRILPTVRYGNWVCAELNYTGFVSVFTPK
jgi:hypothetical protein